MAGTQQAFLPLGFLIGGVTGAEVRPPLTLLTLPAYNLRSVGDSPSYSSPSGHSYQRLPENDLSCY